MTAEIDKVLAKYISLSVGQVVTINKGWEDYDKIINATKFIIDQRFDIINGFELTFNDDYSKIKKYEHNTRANR